MFSFRYQSSVISPHDDANLASHINKIRKNLQSSNISNRNSSSISKIIMEGFPELSSIPTNSVDDSQHLTAGLIDFVAGSLGEHFSVIDI